MLLFRKTVTNPVQNDLKILFIPKWYPSRVHELNGDFIRLHALSVSLKHRVAVLFVSADPAMKNKKYDADCSMDGEVTTVKVFYNNSAPGIYLPDTIINFFRYLKACIVGIRLINQNFGRPDIAHIHVLTRTFFAAFYYSFFYKVPYIISEQWSGYLPEDGAYKGMLKKWFTKIAVKSARAVTAVSSRLKNAMISCGLKNSYSVIPNVVDMKLFYPSADIQRDSRFIFLHVSSLDDRAKYVSGIIHAAKKLSESGSDFELRVVGNGIDKPNLESLAAKLGLLNSKVFFTGEKSSAEVAEMMRKSDCFVLFSNYETFGVVVIEAFASGLPVIATSGTGVLEEFSSERGLQVVPGDVDGLCNAMKNMMAERRNYNPTKIRNYAQDNFSYEVAAEKFDAIYRKVISK
jgi:glycosyltransferase involved in cell wall biosynthesis